LTNSQIRFRNQVDWAEAKRALNATITEVIRREEEEKKECEGVAS